MTVLQGVRVNLDGTAEGVKIVTTADGDTTAALYRLIGCALVEAVDLPEGITLWVDEEGTYRSEYNSTLTAIVRRATHNKNALYGSGVFLGFNENTGDTTSLSRDQLASVIGWWRCVTAYGADPVTARQHLALA